jgi:hypothetical protein
MSKKFPILGNVEDTGTSGSISLIKLAPIVYDRMIGASILVESTVN